MTRAKILSPVSANRASGWGYIETEWGCWLRQSGGPLRFYPMWALLTIMSDSSVPNWNAVSQRHQKPLLYSDVATDYQLHAPSNDLLCDPDPKTL